MDVHAKGVSLLDFVDDVQAIHHLAEARVVSVEVRCILPVVHDEELRPAGVSASVCHAQHALVVVLVVPIQFAVNGVPRPSIADAVRASSLGHKPWDDAVKLEPLIEAFFGQLDEVGDGVGSIFLEKFHGHDAVVGVNRCVHEAKVEHCVRIGGRIEVDVTQP